MKIEQGTFTPLVFSTTPGRNGRRMQTIRQTGRALGNKERGRLLHDYRLGQNQSLFRAALLCLRSSRTLKRRNNLDMGDADLHVEKTEARIH